MALNLGNLGKKIWETLGQGVDRVVPGDQSYLYKQPPSQAIQRAANTQIGRAAQRGPMGLLNLGVSKAAQLDKQLIGGFEENAPEPIKPAVSFVNKNIINPQLTSFERLGQAGAGQNPYSSGRRGIGEAGSDAVNALTWGPLAVAKTGSLGVKAAKSFAMGAPIGVAGSATSDMAADKPINIASAGITGAITGGLNAIPVVGPAAAKQIKVGYRANPTLSSQVGAVGKNVDPQGGGTIRPDKTPDPNANPAIPGQISPDRLASMDEAVKARMEWMKSGKSRWDDIPETPKVAPKQKPMPRQQFNDEAMRISDNLKAGEKGYIQDGSKTYEISSGSKKAKLVAPKAPQVSAVAPAPKTSLRVPGQVTNKETLRGQLATRLVDSEAPAINYLKQVEKTTGQTGLVDQFYYDTGLQKRANAIANSKIESSPNIAKAFGGLNKKANQEFSQYSAAIAELENAKRGMPTSQPVDVLQKTVDDLSPAYRGRFDAIRNEFRAMTDDLVKGGVIDDATKQVWDSNPNYVRIQRVMDDIAGYNGNSGNSYSFGGTNFSKKRTGSGRDVQPLDATVFNMRQQVQKEIQRNQTATNLIEALSSVGHARQINPADATRKNTLRRVVNGQTEIWEVPKDIKEIADNVSPYQLGILGNIVAAPQRLLRAGATGLSAPFTAANYVKDQVSSAVYSKSAMNTHTVPGAVEGLWKASKDFGGGGADDTLWQKFIQTAGDTTSYDFIRNEKNARMLSGQIRKGAVGRIGNSIAHPIRTLENLNQVTEKATRYQNFRGIYNKVLKETGDASEAQKQATLAAWQNSVDFSRMGDVGRAINLLIPYFNAGIQGTRLLGRSLKERPAMTTAKITTFAGIPLASLTLYNMADPERKAVYDNISDYEKENNLIIILPGAKQNEQGAYEGVIKVPLQPGISDLVQPFRLASEAFANQSPADVGKMATQMMGAFSGPIQTSSLGAAASSLIPQVAKPLVQQAANKDFFTGKEIVPEYVQNATDAQGNPVPENKKAYKYTSGSSRIIGDAIGVSPIRVDKFIKDTSAKVGQYTQNAVDTGLAKVGIIPEEQIGGVSVKEDFIRRFAQASSKENLNKSEGAKYFDDRKKATEGLNGNEMAAYDALHPSKTNFLGEDIFDENKRITNYTRASSYLQFPKVYEADKKLDAMQREKGKPGNPLFDLPKDQLTRVLLKATLPPGAKDPELSNLYEQPWYQDFQIARENYYNAVKESLAKEGKTLPESDYPKASPELQKVMTAYNSLPKGTGARSDWIRANPGLFEQMKNQWAAVDDWQNKERVKLGLDATEGADGQASGYSTGSGSSKKYSKGGGSGGSKTIATNPYKFAVSINAGGKVARPKVSVRKTGGKIAKAKKVAGPKVKTKKSMV